MAEPKFEDVEKWLIDNADKEGTPDYVKMTSAYRHLDPQKPAATPTGPAKGFAEDMWGRAKAAFGVEPAAPAEPSNLPDINDIMTAKRLTSDPNSAENTASRIVTGAIGGLPDLGIGLYNAGARTIGSPESQIEPVTPQLQANAGTAPLPADAGLVRRLLEAGGSAFLGGGAGAAGSAYGAARTAAQTTGTATPVVSTALRMATPTVLPTVAGHYGGELGAKLGREYLGDEETGALLGSIIAGTAGAVAPAARTLIHQRYTGRGNLDAPDINAMAQRQGVTPNAGMLGDESIRRREQTLSGQAGGAPVIQAARDTARTGIGDAYNRAADARGSTDYSPTKGTIGYDIATIARQGVDDANARSSSGQQTLINQVGPRADMDVAPIERAILALRGETDPLTAAPLEARLNSIRTMIQRNAANFDAEGNRIASNIPYQQGKDFRTNLRVSGEGYAPVTGHHADTVYTAATDAMRDTATASGVHPDVFDTTQARTHALTGEGGPVQTLTPISNAQQPLPAYNFLRQGEQAPANIRMLEATGNPAVAPALGDYMRLIGNNSINQPGARGPINLANRWSNMAPEARQAIAGPQLDNVADVVGLARAHDVPTNQTGLSRALGNQSEGLANKLIGSEALGHLGTSTGIPGGGTIGRIVGMIGMPGLRSVMASVLEGPTARNALTGGQSPGEIQNLVAAITAAQAAQQQRRP